MTDIIDFEAIEKLIKRDIKYGLTIDVEFNTYYMFIKGYCTSPWTGVRGYSFNRSYTYKELKNLNLSLEDIFDKFKDEFKTHLKETNPRLFKKLKG